ncbi:MAG: YdiU family protein [Emcibacter sp.]|nr:YdiU family protein [Emcibacter sp.]
MKLNFDNQYALLGDNFVSLMPPRPLPNPRMVSINPLGAELIGLTPADISSETALNFFSGAEMIAGANPLAMVYAGHQFGGYSPRLGDGRGLLLGQVRNAKNILWDIHLKGAGPTPFCRGADGRAVLRSSIREYLASEALHHLGIPTSRALCLIHSDEPVRREKMETAAGLIRLSQTHIRFGTFEYFCHTEQHDELKRLADYVLEIHYPEFRGEENPYDQMLLEISGRTAEMIAHWQAFGFAHGVMNTDNMSILGQTFDYGPYGFMDIFDPGYICNHSDDQGRYAFNQQPNIGMWNCLALAHGLKPLIQPDTIDQMKSHYQTRFFACYDRLMSGKLGLENPQEGDRDLVDGLLTLLAEQAIDYTLFFRGLSENIPAPEANNSAFKDWYQAYDKRLELENITPEQRRINMLTRNPKYILRNYLAQTAIEQAEQGDFSEVDRLMTLLRYPFNDQPDFDHYADSPPEWGRHMEISCSS